MAEQLVLALADTGPPTFANFVAGPNTETVALLARVAQGESRETGVVLWGPPGVGKTHLLRASVALAQDAGRCALWIGALGELAEWPRLPPRALVAVDDIDTADLVAQGRLFTLYNALAGEGGQIIAAAGVPPARMALREDLRTRLGWGLVHEIVALPDAGKPAALAAYARERGFSLSPDVINYLLAHGRRDMRSLVETLVALDRESLANKRPVTVKLLRQWMQRELGLG